MQFTYSQTISPEKWAVVQDIYGPRLITTWHQKVDNAGYTALAEPTTNAFPMWFGEDGEFVEVPSIEGESPRALRIDIIGEIEDPTPEGE